MGDTRNWLENRRFADLAFVLVFEGIDLVLTTTNRQVTGVTGSIEAACAGAGAARTKFYSGLHVPEGVTADGIEPFDHAVRPTTVRFKMTDNAIGRLIAALLKEADEDAQTTQFYADADANDNTFSVLDTSAFEDEGTYYAGLEAGEWGSRVDNGSPPDTLTVSSRGKWSLFGTSVLSHRFASSHRLDTHNFGARPEVSTSPQDHYNRRVGLYLVHYRDGEWEHLSEAEFLWAGSIMEGPADDGTGLIEIECRSVLDELNTTLWDDRYEGSVQEGMRFGEFGVVFEVDVTYDDGAGTTGHWNPPFEVLDGTVNATRTHSEIASAINRQLSIWLNGMDLPGTVGDTSWSLQRIPNEQGQLVYAFIVEIDIALPAEFWTIKFALRGDVWTLLGWDGGSVEFHAVPAGVGEARSFGPELVPITDIQFALSAPDLPLRFQLATGGEGRQIVVADARGTFGVQPTMPSWAPAGHHGFLRVGQSQVFPVEQTDTDEFQITYHAPVLDALRTALGVLEFEPGEFVGLYRDDGNADPIPVQQVWIEETRVPTPTNSGGVGDLILRLLVSTGTPGYNHPDYDDHPYACCLNLPWGLIDANAFLSMGSYPYLLVLDKPRKFLDVLESVLGLTNNVCLFIDGQITLRKVGGEAPAGQAEFQLTESNKAQHITGKGQQDPQRARMVPSAATIVNRCSLEYNETLSGEYRRKAVANSLPSQSRYRKIKPINLKTPGIYDDLFPGVVDAWAEDVASSALANWSRPMSFIERTFDVRFFARLYPGAKGTITDNGIVNPRTGTRGITNRPVVVYRREFDWTTGVGKVLLAMHRQFDPARLGLWAPTARVDETYADGDFVAGYDAMTKTLRFKPREYSHGSQAVDLARFAAGYKVHIFKLSEASPTEWFDTLVSVDTDNNEVVLTTGLAGWPGTGYFVMEFDDVITNVAAQLDYAHIADDANNSTGKATNDAYVFGPSAARVEGFLTSTPDLTRVYRKIASTADDAGEPYSVGKLHDVHSFLNCANAYGALAHLVNETFEASDYATQTGETHKLVYGPIRITLGLRPRVLAFHWYGKVDAGTATARLVTSNGLVYGTSETDLVYPDGGLRFVDAEITDASMGFSDVVTLVAPAHVPGQPSHCYVTVELFATSGDTATAGGFYVREAVEAL